MNPADSATSPIPASVDLVTAARQMRADLIERQAATEERTYYSEETHAEFSAAGLYRILQPRRYGGLELDVPTFYKVVIELGRGCPSTAWCFSLASAHALQAATLFSASAQDRLFGCGEFLAAARDAPRGTARRVEGGAFVEGTWNYCSGIPYSTHFLAAATTSPGDGYEQFSGDQVLVALPREDWEIVHDWGNMLGLKGSGSHSVHVAGAFVDEELVLPVNLLDLEVAGGTPGLELHGNSMYCGRQFGFFGGELAAIAVGAARAMLDEYERLLVSTRTTFEPRVPRAEHHEYQRTLGEALGLVDAAETTVLGLGRLYMEYCEENAAGAAEFTLERDYRLDQMGARAGQIAWEAVDMICRSAGSAPMLDGARMQRYLRDFITYRTHQASSHGGLMAASLGKIRLGAGA